MRSRRQLAQLRVLAVLLLVLGISSMHSPDLDHPAAAASGISTATSDVATADHPAHDDGEAPPHHRWLGACLAVLGALGAALAACCPKLRPMPTDRAGRHRSALFDRAKRAWSPPPPCIHQLCVMRV